MPFSQSPSFSLQFLLYDLKSKIFPIFKLVFTFSTNHAVGWGTETYESILKTVHVYSTVFKFYVYIVLRGRILSNTDGE